MTKTQLLPLAQRTQPIKFVVFFCFILSTLLGCGKYASPIAPESLSPVAVQTLQVGVGPSGGVLFQWQAPSRDQRGQPLRSMDGYKIWRADLIDPARMAIQNGDYQLVGTVKDTHILERDKIRAQARAQGKPGGRLDVPAERKQFQFEDRTVRTQRAYLYRIVPVNQGGVDGAVTQYVRVILRGAAPEIAIFERSSIEDSLSLGE